MAMVAMKEKGKEKVVMVVVTKREKKVEERRELGETTEELMGLGWCRVMIIGHLLTTTMTSSSIGVFGKKQL